MGRTNLHSDELALADQRDHHGGHHGQAVLLLLRHQCDPAGDSSIADNALNAAPVLRHGRNAGVGGKQPNSRCQSTRRAAAALIAACKQGQRGVAALHRTSEQHVHGLLRGVGLEQRVKQVLVAGVLLLERQNGGLVPHSRFLWG